MRTIGIKENLKWCQFLYNVIINVKYILKKSVNCGILAIVWDSIKGSVPSFNKWPGISPLEFQRGIGFTAKTLNNGAAPLLNINDAPASEFRCCTNFGQWVSI